MKYITAIILAILILLGGSYFFLQQRGHNRLLKEEINTDKTSTSTPEVEKKVSLTNSAEVYILNDIKEAAKEELESFGNTSDIATIQVSYATSTIDLNNDGTSEIIVDSLKINGSDDPDAGSMGNEIRYLYGQINGNWKRLGVIAGEYYHINGRSINAGLATSTNASGYPDISTFWTFGGGSGESYTYRWDDISKEYKDFTTTPVNGM